jgi:predicted MPP superfamily phosphohydrolase
MASSATEAPRARVRHRRRRRGVPIFLAVLSLVLLLHAYIGSRLIGSLALPAWASATAWLVLALCCFSVPGGFWLTYAMPGRFADTISALGRIWLGVFGVLLSVTVASDLARLIAHAFGAPSDWSVRQGTATLAIGALAVGYALWVARRPVLERVRVPIAGLPPALEGFRIVQISDIHVGEMLGKGFLDRVVERVNALEPDVVAITGDLVEGTVEHLGDAVAPISRLRGKQGVYFVTGNHEYYWGGPAWERRVEQLGVTVLHNEHRVLPREGARVVLGGVTDFDGGAFGAEHASRPDVAFEGAPEGVRVLLAHQPRSVADAAKAGVALQLSGHTHGGQIFPFNFFVLLQQPVIQGLKKLAGVWVYTHRGTGFWGPPMRLGPSPEIAEITLVRG